MVKYKYAEEKRTVSNLNAFLCGNCDVISVELCIVKTFSKGYFKTASFQCKEIHYLCLMRLLFITKEAFHEHELIMLPYLLLGNPYAIVARY